MSEEKERESDVENVSTDGWAVSHIYRETEKNLLTGINSFQVLVGEEKQF